MDNELWFKRTRYGWGWTPTNWKGYAVMVVYLLLTCAYPFSQGRFDWQEYEPEYLAYVGVLSVVVLIICYKKGEKLKWRPWED